MDLLKPHEVSEILDVPVNTLRRWRSERRGPAYIKVGGGIRYRRDDIERYLAERTVEAGA